MIKQVLIFAFGAAAGASAAWLLARRKYSEEMKEQIEYTKILQEENESLKENDTENLNDSIEEHYKEAVSELGYDAKKDIDKSPYIISPEEFGEKEDHETATLYFYKNNVLADSADNVILDEINLVGQSALEHLRQNMITDEEDAIYIRNEIVKTDFEILLIDEIFSRYEKVTDDK